MDEKELRNKYKVYIPGLEYTYPEENFFHFRTKDGLKLNTYRYSSLNPKCLVISFHGIHGSSNSQAVIAGHLSKIGCEVVSFDYRGHGKSDGQRGLLPNFSTLLEDCSDFISNMQAIYCDLPLFLLGVSLGGCLCVHLSVKYPEQFRGMMLLSPALSPAIRFKSLAYCFLSVLNFFSPSMMLVNSTSSEPNTTEKMLRYFEENHYGYNGRPRAGTLHSALQGMSQSLKLLDLIAIPFVIAHGTNDTIVDHNMSVVLHTTSPSPDKTIWLHKGLSHQLIFDPKIYSICEKLQEWISLRF